MGHSDMCHMDYLEAVAAADVAHLREKEVTYQGSWKKRGGVGAFMMMARKWDRLEPMITHFGFDIFAALELPDVSRSSGEPYAGKNSGDDGTPLAEIRDLRRYLLLIEAEMVSRGVVKYTSEPPPVTPLTKSLGMPPPPRPPMPPRTQDGLQPIDYIEAGVHYFTTDFEPHYLVNRNSEPRSVWDHLPRLAVELNNKEHEETLAEYRGLYTWSGEKWVMSLMYREAWGKEP